ncbi:MULTISPECIES: MFS transporter [unclassified Mucilaginibacter]|uniref:MFS transporter n=1 Tax=unclassified Mucilaginibacter TaxID=2617802 RepID=UPI002AC8C55C|nr:MULTISPECIES: MFS transporter [unclassified Mucilaginibacter]MEB0263633.1 MFS transporter [Mucilaginibacter sp. 10I4]MEB0280214.1 MFS transporter [Mucilaginibacter sp. 10B2]MEB0301163.1 MFS transporter [Mucilaginibacter sp. 5C4]WPX24377.1 MFS transporter [Mucilaginibacter sp. 5C4]
MPEDGTITPKTDSFAALKYKDFRSYLGMRFCFTFAYQMQTVVLGFYIYQLTHSKIALAFIGLSEAIPAVGIALYGGYIADKYEKRKMLLIIFVGVFLSSLVMFITTLTNVASQIHTNGILMILYAMIFCNGVARAFYGPTTFSIYAHSIPKELYPNGSTWSSSSWQVASILGPLTGGFIYGFAHHIIPGLSGITATFGLTLIFMLVSIILVYLLREYPPVFIPKENIWISLKEGLNFVFTNKMMFYAMSLDLFSVFFGGVVALLPVFALDILKVGAEGLGIMRMASSLGAALTMLAMIRFSPMNKPWRNLLIAVAGFGVCIIGFGLSTVFYVSLLFLFLQGAFDSVSVIIRGTIMQLLTPDHMRGRVSAVNSMFIGSSNEIGDFESGMAAKLLGTIPAVLFGGSMTLMIVTITFLKTRKLIPLSLKQIHEPEVIKCPIS